MPTSSSTITTCRRKGSMKASNGSSGVEHQNKKKVEEEDKVQVRVRVRVRMRYGECHKNHAASIGGYAVDGCREFMASGEEGTTAAFRCAACSCHRSFHKRESDSDICSSNSIP